MHSPREPLPLRREGGREGIGGGKQGGSLKRETGREREGVTREKTVSGVRRKQITNRTTFKQIFYYFLEYVQSVCVSVGKEPEMPVRVKEILATL